MKRFVVILAVLTALVAFSIPASAAILPFPDILGKELEMDRDINEVRDRLHEGENEEYDYFDEFYTLEVTKDFYYKTFIRPAIAFFCLGTVLFAVLVTANELSGRKKTKPTDEEQK